MVANQQIQQFGKKIHIFLLRFRRLLISTLQIISLLAFLFFGTHPVNAQTSGPADFSAIDAYIQAQMQAIRIPGAALGIIHGNQIVHLKAFGVAGADGRAVTPQTPFIIGSLTKSFTALGIMQLVEAGKIDLETPVQRYLPWFKVVDPAASSAITIRDLLNQDSGISSAADLKFSNNTSASNAALVRELSKTSLATPPGTKFAYANINYVILGLVLEAVSGQSYADYVQQHIFTPLGMTHSFVTRADASRNGLSSGYRYWFGAPVPEPAYYQSNLLTAGYLSSSAEDMAHYLIAQMNGGKYGSGSVLSPAQVQVMQAAGPATPDLGPGASYAMGWRRVTVNGIQVIGHDGATQDMHSMVLMAPGSQWGVVMLFNSDSWLYGQLQNRYDGLVINVLGLLEGQAPTSSGSNQAYLIFDVLALLLTYLQLQVLYRLVRPKGMPAAAPKAGGLVAIRRVVVDQVWPVIHEFLVPIVVLIGFPTLTGSAWSSLIGIDLYAWVLFYLVLLLVSGAVRVGLRLRMNRSIPRNVAALK